MTRYRNRLDFMEESYDYIMLIKDPDSDIQVKRHAVINVRMNVYMYIYIYTFFYHARHAQHAGGRTQWDNGGQGDTGYRGTD